MTTLGHPRRRIILLFVLGIGLPATLLGYLALRGVGNDQALLERERREELSRYASLTGAFCASSLVDLGRALDSVLSGVEPGETHEIALPPGLDGPGLLDWSPDGRWIGLVSTSGSHELLVIENALKHWLEER
jgi:hypothetical protein